MSSRFSAVEPLSAGHVMAGFDCGSPAQSVWLLEHAPHGTARASRGSTSSATPHRR